MIGAIPTLQGKLNTEQELTAKLTPKASLKATLSVPTEVQIPTYTGEYEVTPSQETQILNTSGLKATSNIVINPIPSNYGLITWNGSTLTVS